VGIDPQGVKKENRSIGVGEPSPSRRRNNIPWAKKPNKEEDWRKKKQGLDEPPFALKTA